MNQKLSSIITNTACMTSLNRIPRKRRSIFKNHVAREYGFCGMDSFERGVSRFFHDKQLLQDPDIISPHRKKNLESGHKFFGEVYFSGLSRCYH
mmetsp:Transcript_23772/g.26497  ORF Transcript_23772/g.26497 Transcript_23772/m.26497 type:complete len:94 (+) Transcript_23772:164-445(+)